jgi:hypothetical protein
MRVKEENNEAEETSGANVSWFDRVQLHNAKMAGQAANANEDAADV